MNTKGLFVSLAGLIGAGKSTLAAKLAEKFCLPLHQETTQDDPKLAEFYQDRKGHAFAFNIHLLAQRYRQQQDIFWSAEGAVQDRTLYEDAIFVDMLTEEGSIAPFAQQAYREMYALLEHNMTHPNLIVYLRVSPQTAYARIQKRGRESEINGIGLDYIERLFAHYERSMKELARRIPVLVIDWNEDHQDVDRAAEKIVAFWSEKNLMYEL